MRCGCELPRTFTGQQPLGAHDRLCERFQWPRLECNSKEVGVLPRPARCAFRHIGGVAVELERFTRAACLSDERLFPLQWNRHRTRLAGRKMNDAGAVLKNVPSRSFKSPSVFKRNTESRPSR